MMLSFPIALFNVNLYNNYRINRFEKGEYMEKELKNKKEVLIWNISLD